jgi:hypothetical protein
MSHLLHISQSLVRKFPPECFSRFFITAIPKPKSFARFLRTPQLYFSASREGSCSNCKFLVKLDQTRAIKTFSQLGRAQCFHNSSALSE